MWLQPATVYVQSAYSFMEHLFMHFLFLFIQIYSCILKCYCTECFYFIVKQNIIYSVWEDEEVDHKIYSLFSPIFKFLHSATALFSQNCLEHTLTVLLSEWGRCKCSGEWVIAMSHPKPGMFALSRSHLFYMQIALSFFYLECTLKYRD